MTLNPFRRWGAARCRAGAARAVGMASLAAFVVLVLVARSSLSSTPDELIPNEAGLRDLDSVLVFPRFQVERVEGTCRGGRLEVPLGDGLEIDGVISASFRAVPDGLDIDVEGDSASGSIRADPGRNSIEVEVVDGTGAVSDQSAVQKRVGEESTTVTVMQGERGLAVWADRELAGLMSVGGLERLVINGGRCDNVAALHAGVAS